jgi:hypothetical protein
MALLAVVLPTLPIHRPYRPIILRRIPQSNGQITLERTNLLRQEIEILLSFISNIRSILCIAPGILFIPFSFALCGNTASIFIKIIRLLAS